MSSTKKSAAVLSLLFLFFVLLFPAIAFAQTATTVMESTNGLSYDTCKCSNTTQKFSSACKQYCGAYGTNDFFTLIVKVSNIILGIVGALALLAFVAGGMMFLLSGGSQTWVTRGKATLVGAVIGLLIVFFSYTVIRFLGGKFVDPKFDKDIMSTEQ